MKIYPGSKVAAVALFCGGIFLAQGILGCHPRIELTPFPPQAIGIAPKAGDILEWKMPDPEYSKYELVIPDGVCALTYTDGKHNDDYNTTVIQVNKAGVQCKVLPLPKGAGPVSYYFKYNYDTSSAAYGKGPGGAKPGSVKTLMIAGSCVGCASHLDRDVPKVPGTASAMTPQPAECIKHKAYVSDQYGDDVYRLTVPKELKKVNWLAEGADVTLTFQLRNDSGELLKYPCSNGTAVNETFVVTGSECDIAKDARTAETTYKYSITIDSSIAANKCTYPSDLDSLIFEKTK